MTHGNWKTTAKRALARVRLPRCPLDLITTSDGCSTVRFASRKSAEQEFLQFEEGMARFAVRHSSGTGCQRPLVVSPGSLGLAGGDCIDEGDPGCRLSPGDPGGL